MPHTLNQLWSRQDQTEKCQELLANKKFVSTLKWRSVGHILITLISFFALMVILLVHSSLPRKGFVNRNLLLSACIAQQALQGTACYDYSCCCGNHFFVSSLKSCSAFSTVGSSQNPCFFFFFLLKQGHKGGRGIKRGGQRWSQTQVFAPNVALSHRPDHLLPWATTYQISLGKTASDIFSAQSDAFKISLSQNVWNVSQWPLCHRGWSWQEVCGFLLLVWTYFHYFISLGIAFINIYFLFFPIPS